MKSLAVILILIAAVLAALAPAAYGLLFGYHGHWSALIDIATAGLCAILAVSSFYPGMKTIWVVSFLWVLLTACLGLFHHFQDSGESGPLPFEWINHYVWPAAPLLIISMAFQIFHIKTSRPCASASLR